MLTICRFANRRLFQAAYLKKLDLLTLTRHVQIKARKFEPPPKENHDEFNMRIGRPQSPHLTIYEPQLPSTLSITHRMTGAAMAGYAMLFSVATLALPEPFFYYLDMLQALNLGPIPIYMARFVLAFPYFYHMCNGIRHLIWDLGFFLTIKAVYATGYFMLLSAISLTTVAVVLL